MHDVAKGISNLTVQSKVKPRRRRGLGIAMGLLIAILIFVLGIKALQIGKMMSSPKMMPSVTVTSAPVKEENWPPKLSAVGSVSAAQGAVISAELAGIVSEISFENGAGSSVCRFCIARATPLQTDQGFGSTGAS